VWGLWGKNIFGMKEHEKRGVGFTMGEEGKDLLRGSKHNVGTNLYCLSYKIEFSPYYHKFGIFCKTLQGKELFSLRAKKRSEKY
jgi:hypothetical protein